MADRALLLDILRDVCPDLNFEHEGKLIDDGLIESMDLIAIVTGIMDEFDVAIDVNDLVPENFNSADAMLALINRKL